MADTDYHREKSGLGGIYFVLGAIVVALGILLWFVLAPAGGEIGTASGDANSTSVTIETQTTAPAASDSAPTSDGGASAQGSASGDTAN
ncbi:hypothetical protein [Thioclava pacifica]|uniref:Uncharacterized protein n=1 Tax=Thioclava pacifica DSM 10166 TaxID=1353537 RepID=A0A074JXK3_9RHOB|nr:hypothetical protein [Thioclava pacifica]KEO54072.1 hypothetical protein TP2_03920 [Thioclava pacifica DSM 10166]